MPNEPKTPPTSLDVIKVRAPGQASAGVIGTAAFETIADITQHSSHVQDHVNTQFVKDARAGGYNFEPLAKRLNRGRVRDAPTYQQRRLRGARARRGQHGRHERR